MAKPNEAIAWALRGGKAQFGGERGPDYVPLRDTSSGKIRFNNTDFPDPALKYFSIFLACFCDLTATYPNNSKGLKALVD